MAKRATREVRIRIPESLAEALEAHARALYPEGEPLSSIVREALAAFVATDPLAAMTFAIRESVRTRYSLVARTALGAALRRLAEELDVEETFIRQDFVDDR